MSETMRLTKAWERALHANLRYSAQLGELALRTAGWCWQVSSGSATGAQIVSANNMSPPVHKPVSTVAPPSPAAIVLEGAAGRRAFGLFVVENKLSHPVSARVVFGPLIDPSGREIPSSLRFEPGAIALAPGQQVVVRVGVHISRGFAVGVSYRGDVSVPGIAEARIPVVVRRKPAAMLSRSSVRRKMQSKVPPREAKKHLLPHRSL